MLGDCIGVRGMSTVRWPDMFDCIGVRGVSTVWRLIVLV